MLGTLSTFINSGQGHVNGTDNQITYVNVVSFTLVDVGVLSFYPQGQKYLKASLAIVKKAVDAASLGIYNCNLFKNHVITP